MFTDVLQHRSPLNIPIFTTTVSDSLFNKAAGLQTSNFLKKWLQHRCFTVNVAKFLRAVFFYITPLVTAFMSTRKGRRRCGKKEQGKIFQMKEKNEHILFNFYQQVLVLVKTEMQIQLCKYRTANIIELLTFFSSNFLSCDSCVFIIEKYLLHLSVYSEAGIESYSLKQLLGKIYPKTLILFYKIGVSFQYSLLNKTVYKYIKSEILRGYSSETIEKKSI